MRYWSSSPKQTIDDLKQNQYKKTNRFKDAEDAKFKEITPDDSEDGENK